MQILSHHVYRNTVAVMKKYHATDEVIRETMEKLNKGQVKEGMLIYSEGLDVLKAEEKGKRKKAIETAINFYKMGLTIDQIAQGTGLDKETLKEILKDVER